MKRILALIMILAMLAMAAGCSKSDTPAEPTPTEAPEATNAPDKTGPTGDPVTPEPTPEPTPEAPTKESALTVYADFLDTYAASNPGDSKTMRFVLAFIDADDIPELLIARNADYDTGVEVFRLTESGEVISFGEFGTGAFVEYLSRKNVIRCEESRTEYRNIDFYAIGDDGAPVTLASLKYKSVPDSDGEYTIDGAPATMEDFYAADEKWFSFDDPQMLRFGFSSMQSYADYCLTDRDGLMKAMCDTADRVGEYAGYFPNGSEEIDGAWDLDHFYVGGGAYMPAADASSSVWIGDSHDLSVRFTSDSVSDGFVYEGTSMTLTYIKGAAYDGCENSDYHYNASGDNGWNGTARVTAFTDMSGVDYLEVIIDADPSTGLESDIHLFFVRQFEPQGEVHFGKIVYSPENDTDDLYAFRFSEYIILNEFSSEELLAEYGVDPENMDLDYEVLPMKDAVEQIVYGCKTTSTTDNSTHYEELIFDPSINMVPVSGEDFIIAMSSRTYDVYANITVIDTDKMLCDSIEEAYMG